MKKLTTTLFAAAMTYALGAGAATVQAPTVISNIVHDVEGSGGGDLAFAKFDSHLGNLISVQFELFNTVNGSIYVSNDDDAGLPSDFKVTVDGQLSSAIGGQILSTLPTATKTFTLEPGSDVNYTLPTWTVHNTMVFSLPTDLSAFVGSGDYHALLSAWSRDTLEATNGNSTYGTSILMDGKAEVTYTYQTLAVPEPETYGMLLAGLGIMGVVARRRKSA